MRAQGAGLVHQQFIEALKGRNIRVAISVQGALFRPFRASRAKSNRYPGLRLAVGEAPPWAVIVRPFRPWEHAGRHLARCDDVRLSIA
jgi:hypothetical protein